MSLTSRSDTSATARAKPGIPIDELLGCETLEGLAEGRRAHTVLLDELGGAKPLSRGEFAGHDVPADRVFDLAHQRGTGDSPVTAHRQWTHALPCLLIEDTYHNAAGPINSTLEYLETRSAERDAKRRDPDA